MYFSTLANVSLLTWWLLPPIECILLADERVELVLGDYSFMPTRSEVNKIPWHVKISRTLLKETGYSQSQSRVFTISSSASSNR